MPPPPIIATLPQELREELNRRLVASGYSGLEEQAAWLRGQGVQIGKSAVGEYSLELKRKMEARQERALARVEIHKALGGMSANDKAALLESGELAAYDAYLDAWDDFASLSKEERVKALPGLIRAGADLSRATVGSAKWIKQEREVSRLEALQEAATRVDIAARSKGMSAEQAEFWRKEVLGVS